VRLRPTSARRVRGQAAVARGGDSAVGGDKVSDKVLDKVLDEEGLGSNCGRRVRQSGQRSQMREPLDAKFRSLRPQAGHSVMKRWPGGGRVWWQCSHSEEYLSPPGRTGW